MFLNTVRCDYLTLTTYDGGDAFLSSFRDLFPRNQGKDVKIGGYRGKQWEGLFYGVGKQRERAHFMMRCSGDVAQTMLFRTADLEANCTRIDLQITIWLPDKWDSRALYDTLASDDTLWPGRRLVPEIIQSGDGLDTVYIGSRTSDRFCRIYVKPGAKGEASFLRFEMEYKGAMSREVRRQITLHHASPKAIMRAELGRLPFASSRALRAFERVLGDNSHKVAPEAVYGQNKTLDWLETQVEPAVMRLLHSHEDGQRMREVLDRWWTYAKNALDK